MERIGVIIVAGGSGCRMGTARPKQFLLLDGRPVLAHAIDRFAQALPGAPIVVVLPEEHLAFWRNLTARFDVARHTSTAGGAQRFHSVSRGLAALPPGMELIAVHDGVRPLVSAALIRRTVDAAQKHGAAIPAIEPVDSFRMTTDEGSHPIDRRRLRAVQTPQVFRADLLHHAYETTYRSDFTDDASVVEHSGTTVFLCEGERRNLKITTPDDLLCAEVLLAEEKSAREEEALGTSYEYGPETPPEAPPRPGSHRPPSETGNASLGCAAHRPTSGTPYPATVRSDEAPGCTGNKRPRCPGCCCTRFTENGTGTIDPGQTCNNGSIGGQQSASNRFTGSDGEDRSGAALPEPCCGSFPNLQTEGAHGRATDDSGYTPSLACNDRNEYPAPQRPDAPGCCCTRLAQDAAGTMLSTSSQTSLGNGASEEPTPGRCGACLEANSYDSTHSEPPQIPFDHLYPESPIHGCGCPRLAEDASDEPRPAFRQTAPGNGDPDSLSPGCCRRKR